MFSGFSNPSKEKSGLALPGNYMAIWSTNGRDPKNNFLGLGRAAKSKKESAKGGFAEFVDPRQRGKGG